MKCIPAFRTDNPHRVLRCMYRQQMLSNRAPRDDADFIRLKSRDIFRFANLGLSDTALYSVLTKLVLAEHLSVHSNPEHQQGFKYSITPKGIHCCKCQSYQEGFEPTPIDFKCGSAALDV